MRIILLIILLIVGCQKYTSESDIVTILYFNDAHEISPVVDQLGVRGGVARIKTVMDSLRKINPQTFIVFGGDLAGGSLFGAVYKGEPMVESFNLIPVDLASFGQHDFDFGHLQTKKLVRNSKFPWISSNIKDAEGRSFADLPIYFVKEFRNIKVGFIGLTDAMKTTTPSPKIKQLQVIPAASLAIDKLVDHHPDVTVIIAITQTTRAVNEKLLLQDNRIDLVLSEEQYEHRSSTYYVGMRPILTPCGNMGSVIQVDIINRNSDIQIVSTAHPVDNSIPEEPELHRVQKKYQDSLEITLSETLSTIVSPLQAGINGDFRSRWRESAIGNLIADAYRDYYKTDIGLINGGGIRANISAGEFTLKDAYSVLTFHNKVCVLRIAGSHLRDLLEHGVANVENKGGEFLQISGGSYTYNPLKPAGERVLSIRVNNIDLKPDRLYTVALPDYILKGGNDFIIPKDSEIVVSPSQGVEDVEALSYYVINQESIDIRIENRIIIERDN